MKKYFTCLLLWSALASVLLGQSLSFTRTYGNGFYDDARGIAATPDGGFVFTGLNKSDDIDPDGSMYLTKINAAGAVMWTQYYLRPEEDGGNHVLPASDGGYLLTGHTALSYGVNCDGMLVKTDARGVEQWRVLVGAAYDDVCDAALELPDGSFLVAGRTESAQTRTFRMLLAKVSPSGRVLFQKTIPTAAPSVAYSMIQSADGHLFIAGYTYQPDDSPDKMLVLKCTIEGELLWESAFGSEINHRANGVVATSDGGCFIAGGATDRVDNYLQMIVCRYDAEGNLISSAQLPRDLGPGYLFAATTAPEGRLAVAGVVQPEESAPYQPCFALLNDKLEILDWQTVSLTNEGRTRAIASNPAGGFLIGGNEYLTNGKTDIFLSTIRESSPALKTTAVGEAPVLLFPNPFSEVTYLKIGEPGQKKTLSLSTADGRILRQVTFEGNEYFLQRGGLSAGTYLINVSSKDGVLLFSGKIWVM